MWNSMRYLSVSVYITDAVWSGSTLFHIQRVLLVANRSHYKRRIHICMCMYMYMYINMHLKHKEINNKSDFAGTTTDTCTWWSEPAVFCIQNIPLCAFCLYIMIRILTNRLVSVQTKAFSFVWLDSSLFHICFGSKEGDDVIW